MANTIKDTSSRTRKKLSKSTTKKIDTIIVAIYTRISTKEQFDNDLSLQSQKEKIKNYLNFEKSFSNKNVSTVDYIDENVSAKDLKREQVQKLLADIDNELIDYVIVTRLDRIIQNLQDLQNLISTLESKNVKLISINEKINTQITTGRFFISILGSMVQLEKEQGAENLQDTFKQFIKDKSVGGATPFGYLYSYVKEGDYTAYTQENAQKYNLPPIKVYDKANDEIYPGTYVKYIFDWFISYSSFSKVAKRLNDLAIPIPRVIQEHIKSYKSKMDAEERVAKYILINKPGFWSRTTVRDILLNPFYTGIRVWNRFDGKTNQERDIVDWIFFDNEHEKIIDEKTYVNVTSLYEEIKKKTI